MKIKVISASAHRAQQVADIVRGSTSGLDVLTAASGMSDLTQAVNGSRPDLLVLDGVNAGELDHIGEFTHARPDVETIIISAEKDSEFLLKAMRAGVREVLPPPVSSAALQAAVQRATRKQRPAAPPAELGEVLAFMACKGGSGASFLAANVAHVLSARDGRTVALIDLDLQFGDALLMLSDHAPASNVAEVARNIARLDAELLRAAMVQVSGTLSVLPAPDEIGQAFEVQPEHVEAIIKQARQMFDYVVIDIGRALNAVSLRALDLATHILPVLQLSVPNVRDARRLRDLFRSLDYSTQKIHWLVNRFQKNGEVTLDSLEQTLGVKTIATVPNHFAGVTASVNQGVPIDRLAKKSPVSRALLDLTQRLSPVEAKKRDGWLSTIFGNA
jgi:pilus assembly protein CpaE